MQIDDDLAQIDQQIYDQENKLLKSKNHYQKCKLYKEELKKKLKVKPNNVYGCLYCNHEFRDILTLNRHMESHKEPPNIMPQLLAIQKEIQLQMTNLYEAKQQRKELEFLKQDLKYGMMAAAERNQQLKSEENLNQLVSKYQEKVDKLQNILYYLNNQLSQQQVQKEYSNVWIDDLNEKIMENLEIKLEQEKLVQKQVELEMQNKQQKIKTQKTIQIKEKQMSHTSLRPPSQVFISQQKSGQNKLFKRSGANREQLKDDSSDDEIIMEEEENQVIPIHHPKNISSLTKSSKPKHSKNPSGVSFKQNTSVQGLPLFEQYDHYYQEFNNLVTEMLLNRYYLRRTQFDDNVLEKEKKKLFQQFSDLDQVENLEELLSQLKQQTKGFEKRKRFQKKKKQLQLDEQKQVEKKEKTISSFESSDDQQQTDEDKNDDLEFLAKKCELKKFPFKMQTEQQQENQQEHKNFEAGHGYGVNAFSMDY